MAVEADGLAIGPPSFTPGLLKYSKMWAGYESNNSSQEADEEQKAKDDDQKTGMSPGKKSSEEQSAAEESRGVWDDLTSVSTIGSRQQARKALGYKFKDNAFEQYALHHGMDPKDVTLEMLEKTGGLQQWAYKGIDLGSQGPLRQSLRTQLRRAENREEGETYKLLKPAMQENFAMAWGENRDWKFLTELKTTELVQESLEGKKRAWFTPKGLVRFIGGGHEDEDSTEQGTNWMQSCWNYEDEKGNSWVEWSYGLRAYLFEYEWKVEQENDIERDKIVTELSKSTNVFKQAALERKAVLNYCEKNWQDGVSGHH